MNKNISVWRGIDPPPTNTHVWIKPTNRTINIYSKGLWVPVNNFDEYIDQLDEKIQNIENDYKKSDLENLVIAKDYVNSEIAKLPNIDLELITKSINDVLKDSNLVTSVDTDNTLEDVETNVYIKYVAQALTEELKLLVKVNIGLDDAFNDYYTKIETNQKIDEKISNIVIPEGEYIKRVTQEEYDNMFESNTLADATMYFVTENLEPVALYIGKIQIAMRELGSKGFTYNFPIIF